MCYFRTATGTLSDKLNFFVMSNGGNEKRLDLRSISLEGSIKIYVKYINSNLSKNFRVLGKTVNCLYLRSMHFNSDLVSCLNDSHSTLGWCVYPILFRGGLGNNLASLI